MHRYFIAFAYVSEVGLDFGSVEIQYPRKMIGMDDIRSIEAGLRDKHGDKVTIISWTRFEDGEFIQ